MRAMKTRIIEIGNSQGVRIPLNVLEQAGIGGGSRAEVLGQEIEMTPTEGGILLRVANHARAGWEEEFARMAEEGEDALLDADAPASEWDEREWGEEAG